MKTLIRACLVALSRALRAIPIVVTVLLITNLNQAHGIVEVISPAYRSDINGYTTISISGASNTNVVARCWQSGSGLGQEVIVATISLNGSGNGSFGFPANTYPHGPITISLTAADGDICYLQLYNTGGVAWNEGLSAVPQPSQASDMVMVFEDDFNGPLSISTNGAGTTYSSHMTDPSKDFSRPRFRDYEDANGRNPFFQRDTYLRIRTTVVADELDDNGNTIQTGINANNALAGSAGTGLLNSYGASGDGFTMQIPFYMECRMVAQRAKGSWPAFWALSLPDGANSWAELDIIEAYGSAVTNGFHKYVTSVHHHNVDPNQKTEAYTIVNMESSAIGGIVNLDWATSPQTYGCLVTETTTTFYLNDVAVWSQPTDPVWLDQDFYFLINYAFAGTSGWKSKLSRYGYASDMYVDWVRVYAGNVLAAEDIGAVGISGSTTTSNGTYTIQASGRGVWGNSDQFHYVYTTLNGDGEVLARVQSLGNTNNADQAGVMIRDTLDIDSNFAFNHIKPNGATKFLKRTTIGASTSQTDGGGSGPWVRLVRTGNLLTGYRSSDGINWLETSSASISMTPLTYVGMAVSSFTNNSLTTAVIDNFDVIPYSASLISEDIGNVGVAGSASESNGAYTIQASGAGVWGNSDKFHFLYTTLNGDGQITARVSNLTNTNNADQVGVMIRDTLDADSKFAFCHIKPNGGTKFLRRTAAGTSTSQTDGGGNGPWVRLVRTGNLLTGYRSTDGITWSQTSSETISMSGTVYVGLAASSFANNTLTTAVFDNLDIQ